MVKQLDHSDVEGVELQVWSALAGVHDPEIPPCTIIDLGIVKQVRVGGRSVEIELLPTFAGCPALDVIREDVTAAAETVAEGRQVSVRFVYSPPWTSDRITDQGRARLREYGVTPPGQGSPGSAFVPLASLRNTGSGERVPCPYCGADDTVLESAFGPTLCRSTRYCPSCRNPFEAFKPKVLDR